MAVDDGTIFILVIGSAVLGLSCLTCTVCWLVYICCLARDGRNLPVSEPPARKRSATEIIQRFSLNLRPVNAADIQDDDVCAICLNELYDAVAEDTSKDASTVQDDLHSKPTIGSSEQAEGSRASTYAEQTETTPKACASAAKADREGDDDQSRTACEGCGSLSTTRTSALPWAEPRVAAPWEDTALRRADAKLTADCALGPGLQSLLCGHRFHGRCIRKWIVLQDSDATCPLCKEKLTVGLVEGGQLQVV
mmetsp:Transcript_9732/g.13884  ORF Transcript_9732/g.13884 Transcript_9732/m.13884 type:complete len:251 (-) Transcript_9732:581-1333(-)